MKTKIAHDKNVHVSKTLTFKKEIELTFSSAGIFHGYLSHERLKQKLFDVIFTSNPSFL